jgi:hypothetical protein
MCGDFPPKSPTVGMCPTDPVTGKVMPCPSCCPHSTSSVTLNKIDIVYDPTCSTKVKQADKIAHVQFIRSYIDGAVVTQTEFYSGFSYREVVAGADGWYVDFVKSDTVPYYQMDAFLNATAYGSIGSKNGIVIQSAKMLDVPKFNASPVSEDALRFYDPVVNKIGRKSIKHEFVTFAICVKGADCGAWYEAIKWEYSKTWENQRDGLTGDSVIIDNCFNGAPTAGQLEAFNKFNTSRGFKPCSP